ncbi:phage holin family protein [Actinoalloteichus hymeniacidonis]|uniref:DUF1469 family protein n=1 Tax=Actinoalloteichus hymeniacidonis TaxID=340345 RepID=A0AAC9HKW8_9PSEU|nr:phage holin family protein [Actinoalloteichus hymeniacidonis]AOS61105.1 putative DUF1469 family protein [Actinoalloteichus hymeniacidonis]MBB5910894.1 hypothetical protein [Actinoalloteichus hymeniacidonis]
MSSAGHDPKRQQDWEGLPPVHSIPLSEENETHAGAGDRSLGGLVREASVHLSTLIRAEVELARQEIAAEVRKGVRGSVFFILALTVLAFSSFFLFFTAAELLSVWLPRWAGFGIVFLVMLLVAAWLAFLGYRRVRKIRKPERTIQSVRDTASRLRSGQENEAAPDSATEYRAESVR